MRGEQGRKSRRITPSHAALRTDAVDARVAPGSSKSRCISRTIIVMDETEIELRFRPEHELLQWRKIGIIRAPFGHGEMEELNGPLDAGHDGIRHLNHETG